MANFVKYGFLSICWQLFRPLTNSQGVRGSQRRILSYGNTQRRTVGLSSPHCQILASQPSFSYKPSSFNIVHIYRSLIIFHRHVYLAIQKHLTQKLTFQQIKQRIRQHHSRCCLEKSIKTTIDDSIICNNHENDSLVFFQLCIFHNSFTFLRIHFFVKTKMTSFY